MSKIRLPLLLTGWIVCFSLAIWAIVATWEWVWMPWWFVVTMDVFYLFVAFALPAKMVILVDSLSKDDAE